MNKKTFIAETTKLIQIVMKLNRKALKHGIPSLEEEVEDLDDEDLKRGLRLIIDGADTGTIEDVFSKKISFEKDKYTQMYLIVLKRSILGIQAREKSDFLLNVLMSCIDLEQKEKNEMGTLIRSALDKYQQENSEDDDDAEDQIIENNEQHLSDFDAILRLDDRSLQTLLREIDSSDLAKALKTAGKELREKIFNNLSKRTGAMLSEEMDVLGKINPIEAEEAQKRIVDVIEKMEP